MPTDTQQRYEDRFASTFMVWQHIFPKHIQEELLAFIEEEKKLALDEQRKTGLAKIWDMLFESYPSDMENFSTMTDNQAYRLLQTFWKKLESATKLVEGSNN